MKLIELKIEGFRSLRDVVWEPGDLNILIGPNAGGKSNLLRAVEFVAMGANEGLGTHVQEEGGFGALVWDGQTDAIKFSIIAGPNPTMVDIEQSNFRYVLDLRRVGKSSDYRVNAESLNRLSEREKTAVIMERPAAGNMAFARRGPRTYPNTRAKPEVEELYLPSFVREGGAIGKPDLALFLSGWAVYQQFRTDRDAKVRQPIISRSDQIVDRNGDNLISVLHTLYTQNRQFKEVIDDAMSAAFPELFEELTFPPDTGDQRVQLRVRWKHLQRDCSMADMSDGTLRFLYSLAILANPNPPSLIAIDEPETGLHPRMLSIVAEFAAEAARRTQVVVATHSSELLDSFNRFQPTTSVVECHGGETQIKNVSAEKLAHWLKGYTLGDLFRSHELETMT